MSQEDALKIAFPYDSKVERKTIFLNEEQITEIQKKSKAKMHSEIVTYYIGETEKNMRGYAFFESHNVRTMPETMMTVLNPDGSVKMVEILAFHEPPDYKASKKWLEQLEGKKEIHELWVKRGLRNITGSTLTTQAIAEGVRRQLAIFEIILRSEQ